MLDNRVPGAGKAGGDSVDGVDPDGSEAVAAISEEKTNAKHVL